MKRIVNISGTIIDVYQEGMPVPVGGTVVEISGGIATLLSQGIEHVYSFPNSRWEITARGVTSRRAENWRRVRVYRDALLVVTDFTQLPDSPYDPTAKAAWAAYRQALRNVTHQPDPTAIVWPDPPLGDYPWLRAIPPMQVL